MQPRYALHRQCIGVHRLYDIRSLILPNPGNEIPKPDPRLQHKDTPLPSSPTPQGTSLGADNRQCCGGSDVPAKLAMRVDKSQHVKGLVHLLVG